MDRGTDRSSQEVEIALQHHPSITKAMCCTSFEEGRKKKMGQLTNWSGNHQLEERQHTDSEGVAIAEGSILRTSRSNTARSCARKVTVSDVLSRMSLDLD